MVFTGQRPKPIVLSIALPGRNLLKIQNVVKYVDGKAGSCK